jgi:hypothetical protein
VKGLDNCLLIEGILVHFRARRTSILAGVHRIA